MLVDRSVTTQWEGLAIVWYFPVVPSRVKQWSHFHVGVYTITGTNFACGQGLPLCVTCNTFWARNPPKPWKWANNLKSPRLSRGPQCSHSHITIISLNNQSVWHSQILPSLQVIAQYYDSSKLASNQKPNAKIRRPGSACTVFFSYVASKILSQGAHPKSPVQNPRSPKSKIQNPQNPKSPKSKIPKFQNPNFAHKDLLHNVPKIQNPKSPKSRKSKIQNPKSPKSKKPKSPQSKIQNPQNPKNPKSKIPKIQNPQNPKSKLFWPDFGDFGFGILDFGDFGFWIWDSGPKIQNPNPPKSKIQNPHNPKSKIPKIPKIQNPKSPKSKIQNPQNPKSKILRRNPKFGAFGASRKELLPNDAKSSIQNPQNPAKKAWILDFGDFGFWIFWILDFGFWGFWGFWILDFGDFGFWILGILGFWVFWILDFGDFGFWGFWILDFGDFGDFGFWDFGEVQGMYH